MTVYFILFQVRTIYVSLRHVMSGYVWLDQVRSIYFRLVSDMSGYVTLFHSGSSCDMLGHVFPVSVRLVLVMLR
jgi:hypothetical protein